MYAEPKQQSWQKHYCVCNNYVKGQSKASSDFTLSVKKLRRKGSYLHTDRKKGFGPAEEKEELGLFRDNGLLTTLKNCRRIISDTALGCPLENVVFHVTGLSIITLNH